MLQNFKFLKKAQDEIQKPLLRKEEITTRSIHLCALQCPPKQSSFNMSIRRCAVVFSLQNFATFLSLSHNSRGIVVRCDIETLFGYADSSHALFTNNSSVGNGS